MMTANHINSDAKMHQDPRGHSEDEKTFQLVSDPPKSIRNFTDLPAPFYSQRGSLISHENHSVFIKESGYADRTNTSTSLQSLISDQSDPEDNQPLKSATRLNKEFYAAEISKETSDSIAKRSGVEHSSSSQGIEGARSGSLDIRRDQIATGNSRNKLPTFLDNPSTPTDFSHLSKESVDSDNYSNASSHKNDDQIKKKVLNKWILLAMIGLLLFGIFSLAFQWYQSLYVARDEKNDKELPFNISITEITSYITRHPENRIGLWSECNDFSCIDLRIFCSYEDIQRTLIESGLVSFATESQVDDFVKNQLHLCPMIKVSRFTSVLSLFAAAIALIGLFIAFFKNQKIIYLAIRTGGIIMVLLTLISLALFIAIKEILDHLVSLAQNYSAKGSSTDSPYVDTFYRYSISFWLCCVSFILSLILAALFFVMSNSADKLRSTYKSGKSDLYSASSLESVDVGPRVNTVTSQDSSTIKVSESIHNLSQLEPTQSFEPPPAADTKAVRFS